MRSTAHRPRRRRLAACLGRTLAGTAAALVLPAAAAQALSYERASATAQNGSASSSITVNNPTGVVVGDVEVASIDALGTAAITMPSGWTSIASGQTYTGYAVSAYHVVAAGDPSSWTWTLGTTRQAVGRIDDYLGVSTSNPVQVTNGQGNTTGTTAPALSVTTTTANTLVVVGAAAATATGSFTWTDPGGVTATGQTFDNGPSGDLGLDTASFTQAVAGATPTKTFGMSTSIPWGTRTIALAPATGVLAFGVAPSTPALGALTLNGTAGTLTAQMNNVDVDDTTSGSGWNVTVQGQTGTGNSPVFARYCPSAGGCGADAMGYVSGGATLPAGSLTLNTTGATWSTSGGSGAAPTFQCASGCAMDGSSATAVASAANAAGLGPWQTSGFSTSSVTLKAPTTTHSLPSGEQYRVNLLWTLNSGP